MSESQTTAVDRTVKDRRFLPRADAGRRAEDVNTAGGIGGEMEIGGGRYETKPLVHLLFLLCFSVFGIGIIWLSNVKLAPLLFHIQTIEQVGRVLAEGSNYATYDLNINSRTLRAAHIANLDRTPELVVLGASHWQEGNKEIIPQFDYYNAHIHRDYYGDMLGVAEMLVRNNRLPEYMIITIRDNLFTPVADRTDFLWQETKTAYYDMAGRLDLPTHSFTETLPLAQIRASISLSNLHANLMRMLDAPVPPHRTTARKHPTLDILLSDGSIKWSRKHDDLFTQKLARKKALDFAHQRRFDPPKIDPPGVVAIDTLLDFLTRRGVKLALAHPPFNPIYFDAVDGYPYMEGLAAIENLTKDLANKYGLDIVGSFDPRVVGCTSDQYIDAEHSNPNCLQKILQQFARLHGR